MYYMSTVEVAPDTSWTSYRPSTSTENVDIHNAALIRETKSLANVIYVEDSNH